MGLGWYLVFRFYYNVKIHNVILEVNYSDLIELPTFYNTSIMIMIWIKVPVNFGIVDKTNKGKNLHKLF